MNPSSFPIATAMQRMMAEDANAPELRHAADFERQPYRHKGLMRRIKAFLRQKTGASMAADKSCCEECAHNI